MLDQSFSVENFRRILDYENRKGVYLESMYFPHIALLSERLKSCYVIYKKQKAILNDEAFNIFKSKYNKVIDSLECKKESLIFKVLSEISEKATNSNFTITLKKKTGYGPKPVFVSEKSPEIYFALKQIQYNFNRLYKVKQSNRFEIINHLKCLLSDNMPKYLLKTDISDFYESIPHDKLLAKLQEDNLLSYNTLRLIKNILDNYSMISGSPIGLPRGIGISAFLAELYMRDFDNNVKLRPDVTYYARYVDDIFIIFTPSQTNVVIDYCAEIEDLLSKSSMIMNRAPQKTVCIDLITNPRQNYSFDYLGYKFVKNVVLHLDLSSNKIMKIKKRIDVMIKSYTDFAFVNEKKARKLLINRVRFLTSNCRLLNRKNNVIIGIFFSHSLLTRDSSIQELDKYLEYKIDTHIKSNRLKLRLAKYRFVDGYRLKRFILFKLSDLIEILKCW